MLHRATSPLQLSLLEEFVNRAQRQGKRLAWQPIDLGGSRNSPHAWALHLMHRKGWLERLKVSEGELRPRYAYRLTDEGLLFFKEHLAAPGPGSAGKEKAAVHRAPRLEMKNQTEAPRLWSTMEPQAS